MSLRLLGLAIVIMAVLFEALGQLALKHGVEGTRVGGRIENLLRRLWRSRSVAVGIMCFAVQAVLWTMALRLLEVSIAFPASSLCFVFVALLSKLWLKEQIEFERWIGFGLIMGGVAMIGLS
jgi:undecaprenyl phosphate-alpha-L-ara4N flippase subunit ArnE